MKLWPWTALRAAREHLDRAEQDDDRVNAVSEKSEQLRAQNGFLRAIDQALGRPI